MLDNLVSCAFSQLYYHCVFFLTSRQRHEINGETKEINKYWDTQIKENPQMRPKCGYNCGTETMTMKAGSLWTLLYQCPPSANNIYIYHLTRQFFPHVSPDVFFLFLWSCPNFLWFQKEHKMKPTILTAKWSHQRCTKLLHAAMNKECYIKHFSVNKEDNDDNGK